MRRLAHVECPDPPESPYFDMAWYVGCYGRVVAIDEATLAVRMDEHSEWPTDIQHLLLSIFNGKVGCGIIGDAVVVGRVDDIMISQYFPTDTGIQSPLRSVMQRVSITLARAGSGVHR